MAYQDELYGRPWAEREYIIVFDTYMDSRDQPYSPESNVVQELARLMGRTPAAICMRMENFASLDPARATVRRGLGHVTPLCRRIVSEWSSVPDKLKVAASVLRRDINERWAARTLFDSDSASIPRAFGKYELLDQIGVGQGSFGTVFVALDTESGEQVAIKVIQAGRVADKEKLSRFGREIRALKSVRHRSVIAIREDNVETEKEFPGYVMELAERSLTDLLDPVRQRMIPRDEAKEIMEAVAGACIELHHHTPRIIHRDINPNNILRLSDGRWVLADFSLAKFLGAEPLTGFATLTNAQCGTSYYGSPEQYRDLRMTDERSDVYALGVLLWELYSTEGPPPPRQQTGLPAELERIYLRATEREARLRYSGAREFREQLMETVHFAPSSSK
jgi:serine/threonine protein kinase